MDFLTVFGHFFGFFDGFFVFFLFAVSLLVLYIREQFF